MIYRSIVPLLVTACLATACQRSGSSDKKPAETAVVLSQSLGPVSAKIHVVEMGDFACPACKAIEVGFATPVLRKLAAEGKIRLTFQDFPLAAIHPRAIDASAAAACAAQEGRFWEYHDILYAHQDDWVHDDSTGADVQFRQLAVAAGLPSMAFKSCMDAGRFRAAAQAAWDRGVRDGFRATPTFVVDGERLPPGSGNAVVHALQAKGVDMSEFLR